MLYHAQVVIPNDNNLAEDAVVNTWNFVALDGPGAITEISDQLEDFYTAWQTYRSSAYQWQLTRLKIYDQDEPAPRVPVYDAPLGLTADAAPNTLPHEVAICLSYQAERESGQNQARRRGRVYLGPFASAANNTSDGRPATALVTALGVAARALLVASNSAPNSQWVVWSRTAPSPANTSAVDNGWIDNAFDTQRRRGMVASSRTVFNALP